MLPTVTFDLSRPRMSLFEAALFFVRRGHSGPLMEDFDTATIDPLFRLFDDGVVAVTGIRAGSSIVENVTGCWRTATCGDLRIAKPNLVFLEADPSAPLGSYVTPAGARSPLWTHLEVSTGEMVAVFEGAPADLVSAFNALDEQIEKPSVPKRGYAAGIEAAMSALWPEGLPDALPVKERDDALFEEMKRQGTTTKTEIDPVTFRRYFRQRSKSRGDN
ncbi:hypothetical protein [uncultured Devosia sp.]|uniref:hypothetical protein n=1 Tax=uncultured Devosia sp. TaxID=211434 RepID=UPI0035CBF8A4